MLRANGGTEEGLRAVRLPRGRRADLTGEDLAQRRNEARRRETFDAVPQPPAWRGPRRGRLLERLRRGGQGLGPPAGHPPGKVEDRPGHGAGGGASRLPPVVRGRGRGRGPC